MRPTNITLAGLAFGLSAVAVLFLLPAAGPVAAILILAAWFMDRTDGLLARQQRTASPFGAWLDANVDELHDVSWHAASAHAASALGGTQIPWYLLIGFLGGKYLFMNGLAEERALLSEDGDPVKEVAEQPRASLLRSVYHLPGNADIRLHLLVAALVSGWMTAELAVVAVYYNLRWIVRFGLVRRRLGGRS